MKNFLILLTFLILFSGCSSRSAFYEFKMDRDQTLAVSNLKSSKLLSKDGNINGIFSAIYLNEVYPEEFNQNDAFFIFFFTKTEMKLSINEPSKKELKVVLGSKTPSKIEELEQENKFSHLVGVKNSWSRYYLVTFEKIEDKTLSIEEIDGTKTTLQFKKSESN